MRSELDTVGFLLVRGIVSEQARRTLVELTSRALASRPVLHRSGQPFAARGLLQTIPELSRELESHGVTALASRMLAGSAIPIDALYFDKHADANWTVPGHQDRMMPGEFNPTGTMRFRDGLPYAQPDEAFLSQLVACRIHLDDTSAEAGALCFVPGTHRLGLLSAEQIRAISIEQYQPCPAAAGDVLFMRPLVLHRSSPSAAQGHRRVLHVVFSSAIR